MAVVLTQKAHQNHQENFEITHLRPYLAGFWLQV